MSALRVTCLGPWSSYRLTQGPRNMPLSLLRDWKSGWDNGKAWPRSVHYGLKHTPPGPFQVRHIVMPHSLVHRGFRPPTSKSTSSEDALQLQTAQLDKELMLMSFPAPPFPNEEGQVVSKRPPPAPYENDIHMDDVNDIDAIPQSPPTP